MALVRHGGEVLVTLVDVIVLDNFHAQLLGGLADAVGQALGVGGLVVDDENGLGLQGFFEEPGGSRCLIIVTAAQAKHVGQAAVGHFFVGGGRGQHGDVFFGQGLGARDRGRGAVGTDDAHDFQVDQLVG